PDLKPRDLKRTPIVEVDGSTVLGDGTREVSLHVVENEHAKGMLIGYVADARLGFVTDLWSPGRDTLEGKLTSGQAAVVTAVKQAGITPLKFAGGHGTTADYAPLEALAAK